MDMTELKQFETEVGKIKLSTAMRIGCTMTEPLDGTLVSTDGKRACAIGAAIVGAGKWDDYKNGRVSASDIFANNRVVALWSQIAGMNNSHEKTREEVADWLEAQGL